MPLGLFCGLLAHTDPQKKSQIFKQSAKPPQRRRRPRSLEGYTLSKGRSPQKRADFHPFRSQLAKVEL